MHTNSIDFVCFNFFYMKKLITIAGMALVILTQGCGSSGKSGDELSGDLTLSGAFALYPMAQQWGEEFMKLNPKVRIDISAGGAGKGMTDVLSGLVNIGMVSREISPEEKAKGAFGIPVTRDAVVAIINAENPMLQVIMNKGLTKEQFKGIFITGSIKTWGELTGDKTNKDKINVYTRADACGAADVWAKYLGGKQENLQGTGVQGDPGVTEAVKSDKFAIGFNNICYAYDSKTKAVTQESKWFLLISTLINFYRTKKLFM